MGNGDRQRTDRTKLRDLVFDDRGRVHDPRPLDRFFYDRNEDKRDDIPEHRESDRHRAMYWELLGDYFAEGGYSKWYERYYETGAANPDFLTHWPGYGQAGETFPFGTTESGPPALKRVPGLNVGPNQVSDGDQGNVARRELEDFHHAWDQTQEVFEAGRGGYEVYTDINVAIVDGFAGSYQIGDSRSISKTPKNEEYTYVEQLHEHLYGMKDGWTWTTISGSKEMQCAALGELSWGRAAVEQTFIDYNHAGDLANGAHAWDPNSDGSKKDPAACYGDQVGSEDDYGIVVKEQMGPIGSADEAWVNTEDPNYDVNNSKKHEIWSYSKVGRTGGVEVTEKTISDLSSGTAANKIWSETKVGSNFATTEEITDSRQRSTLTLGNLNVEEVHDGNGMATKIEGNDGEAVFGHKWDVHMGNVCSVHAGTAEEFFFGGKAEMFVGGKVELSFGGSLEIAIGVPVVGGLVAGIAAAAGDAWGGAESYGIGGGIIGGLGGGIGGLLEGLVEPTEIFVGHKNELFVGRKTELSIANAKEITLGKKEVFGVKEIEMYADIKKYSGAINLYSGIQKFVGGKLDFN